MCCFIGAEIGEILSKLRERVKNNCCRALTNGLELASTGIEQYHKCFDDFRTLLRQLTWRSSSKNAQVASWNIFQVFHAHSCFRSRKTTQYHSLLISSVPLVAINTFTNFAMNVIYSKNFSTFRREIILCCALN